MAFRRLKELDRLLTEVQETEETRAPKKQGIVRTLLRQAVATATDEVKATASAAVDNLAVRAVDGVRTSIQQIGQEMREGLIRDREEATANAEEAAAQKADKSQRRSEYWDVVKALLLPDPSIKKQAARAKEEAERERKRRGKRWPKPVNPPTRKSDPNRDESKYAESTGTPIHQSTETSLITQARDVARSRERNLHSVRIRYDANSGQVVLDGVTKKNTKIDAVKFSIDAPQLKAYLVAILIDLGHINAESSINLLLITIENLISELRTKKIINLTAQ